MMVMKIFYIMLVHHHGEDCVVDDEHLFQVGQGWWMASGVDGKEGIIPEAYVERVPDIAGPQV